MFVDQESWLDYESEYSRQGHPHAVGSQKAEISWKASYFSFPSYIIHMIPESRNAGWGCERGNQRSLGQIYTKLSNAGVTVWSILWDLLGHPRNSSQNCPPRR